MNKYFFNFAEKFSLVLIFFVCSVILYIIAYLAFGISDTNNSLFKDSVQFGVGVSSIALAILLYSDWREKYAVESLDKDLREAKILVKDIHFILNQYWYPDDFKNESNKNSFFNTYWNLKVSSSNIRSKNLYELADELDVFLKKYHDFLNKILTKESGFDANKETASIFKSINTSIDNAQKMNLRY